MSGAVVNMANVRRLYEVEFVNEPYEREFARFEVLKDKEGMPILNEKGQPKRQLKRVKEKQKGFYMVYYPQGHSQRFFSIEHLHAFGLSEVPGDELIDMTSGERVTAAIPSLKDMIAAKELANRHF